ncbi:DUF4266 domain-containing protein [Hyunsoonleella rubra]|uniref:DUF4266 domain-containing protein n=1 Tax=Hyunsoonleella rubra TaxID=1737062 RepID=A0ABW5TE31_9FLAO
MKIMWLSLLLAILLSSCKAVKPYEQQYVSDPEMQMQNDTGKNFNLYVQSIREGATPAGSAKGSGGCGCN